jgi:peroxiredoxin
MGRKTLRGEQWIGHDASSAAPQAHRCWPFGETPAGRRLLTISAFSHGEANSGSDMARLPIDFSLSDSSLDRGGVLVTLGRADTALYAPLRDWMTASNLAEHALKAGDEAPDFFLPDDRAQLVGLRSMLEKGPVVLSFLGGGWCSFCIAKLKALSAALEGRGGLPVTLLAITPETGSHPRRMRAAHRLQCTVLSDVDYGVGLMFGVISVVPSAIVTEMGARGLDLSRLHGAAKPMLAAPAVYLIEPSGQIAMASLDHDYMTSADIQGLMAALERIS